MTRTAANDAPPVCNCSVRHPHKGRGADPAHCPVHGDAPRVIAPAVTDEVTA